MEVVQHWGNGPGGLTKAAPWSGMSAEEAPGQPLENAAVRAIRPAVHRRSLLQTSGETGPGGGRTSNRRAPAPGRLIVTLHSRLAKVQRLHR